MNPNPRILTAAVLAFVLTLAPSLPAQTPATMTSPGPVAVDEGKAVEDAQTAALAWLKLVDQGSYAESWQTAADYFQKHITQERWVEAIKGARPPLGEMVARKMKGATFTKTVRGGPDGEYVIIQYDTEFTHKKAAVETITPMRAANGTWKVSGYYVK